MNKTIPGILFRGFPINAKFFQNEWFTNFNIFFIVLFKQNRWENNFKNHSDTLNFDLRNTTLKLNTHFRVRTTTPEFSIPIIDISFERSFYPEFSILHFISYDRILQLYSREEHCSRLNSFPSVPCISRQSPLIFKCHNIWKDPSFFISNIRNKYNISIPVWNNEISIWGINFYSLNQCKYLLQPGFPCYAISS